MNKERFHNALALSLGYERIVKDKRFTIDVDDSDDPWVTLKIQGSSEFVRIKASGDADSTEIEAVPEMDNEIKSIVVAVHQAFQRANEPF